MFEGLKDISGAPSFTGGAGGTGGNAWSQASQNLSQVFNSSGWTVNTGSGSASGGMNPLVMGAMLIGAVLVWKFAIK